MDRAVAAQIGGAAGARLSEAAGSAYVEGMRLAYGGGALVMLATAVAVWRLYPTDVAEEEPAATAKSD